MKSSDHIHFIRLHGPWQATVVRNDSQDDRFDPLLDQPARVHVPSDWPGAGFCGLVRYERSFGLPTGLVAEQQVNLFIGQIDFRAAVILNDQPLGSIESTDSNWHASVRDLLSKRNRLQIEIEVVESALSKDLAGQVRPLFGEVRLEIEEL